ncbi:hypothetical protein AOLI_G00018370 [Acnodon oligacanthus]
METSPLGDLVKALSLLQQTQHQALLDAQRENQARFEALAQGQEVDSRLLRSLLSGPSTPAPTPATMSVSKMTPQDDPEAFVELFERAAGDWGWPKKDWAIRLLPLHMGKPLPAQSQLKRAELRSNTGSGSACCHSGSSTGPSCWRNNGRIPAGAQGPAAEPTRAGVKPGQVCWRCGEPGHFQDQCHHMEVGTLVQVPISPPASPDRAGMYRIPENLLQAQERQSRSYNRAARLRRLSPGDKVLVLLPTSSSKLLVKWQGPFEVTRRVGEVDYEVKQTDRGGALQVYHLNLLKSCREAVPVSLTTVVPERAELGPEVPTKWNHTLVPCGDQLSSSQKAEVARLQTEFSDVFSPLPGRTDLIEHHIETPPGVVVCSWPYRLPEHKKVVQDEIKAMLDMGTDALERGLGAVLSQVVEGEERPVLYISRKLAPREVKYSTIEKECLAIKWAVLTLRYYLLGCPFTLCSDHAPLQWLHRMKDSNSRIMRWYLALQPFRFEVVHRPGGPYGGG